MPSCMLHIPHAFTLGILFLTSNFWLWINWISVFRKLRFEDPLENVYRISNVLESFDNWDFVPFVLMEITLNLQLVEIFLGPDQNI